MKQRRKPLLWEGSSHIISEGLDKAVDGALVHPSTVAHDAGLHLQISIQGTKQWDQSRSMLMRL